MLRRVVSAFHYCMLLAYMCYLLMGIHRGKTINRGTVRSSKRIYFAPLMMYFNKAVTRIAQSYLSFVFTVLLYTVAVNELIQFW
jgi:hypothetical protein